jgi:hypothetical protein
MKAHVLSVTGGNGARPAQAVVIDFEGLPDGENAGNVLAASAVTFATGTIPNLLTPTITFTPVSEMAAINFRGLTHFRYSASRSRSSR